MGVAVLPLGKIQSVFTQEWYEGKEDEWRQGLELWIFSNCTTTLLPQQLLVETGECYHVDNPWETKEKKTVVFTLAPTQENICLENAQERKFGGNFEMGNWIQISEV